MSNLDKWRAQADKILSAQVKRQRNIKSVAGKVEDRFDAILSARRRGMPWTDIAKALEDGSPIKVDAVESAFKRICFERGIVPPSRRPNTPIGNSSSNTKKQETAPAPQPRLFPDAPERWVDDGE